MLTGFRHRDAEALRAVDSDDADRVNAFGTVKHGREEIVDYLRVSRAAIWPVIWEARAA
ncbi:MAG: hypothetical protein ACRDUT_08855 [Mycobacterium sp.]